MSTTEVAAWWGAVTATLVLIWDIFKWLKSGARLRVTVSPNMIFVPSLGGMSEDKNFVLVEAANIGDQKTTLTNLVGMQHKTRLHKIFRRKPVISFVVPTPLSTQQIPYQLGPGERYMGSIEQNADMEKMMKEGVLYIGVCHSSCSTPVYVRAKRKSKQ